MSLKDMIDSIHERVERGEIDRHQGNLETSQVLSRARKELVDATHGVLAQFGDRATEASHEQVVTAGPFTAPDPTPYADRAEGGEIGPDRNGAMDIDDFLLKWSVIIRGFLDNYIKTRTGESEIKKE